VLPCRLLSDIRHLKKATCVYQDNYNFGRFFSCIQGGNTVLYTGENLPMIKKKNAGNISGKLLRKVSNLLKLTKKFNVISNKNKLMRALEPSSTIHAGSFMLI
jgi:hypothetical protein